MINPCKFSIITPSLNQGIYIKDNIESVLSQNYEKIEHIIIDGCSSDNTLAIIKNYSHLKWISEPDKGAANAINKGIKLSKGDIITWLNSDDFYEKDILKDVAEIFNENNSINFVYGNLTFVSEEKKNIRADKTLKYDLDCLVHKNADIIRQPCTFFRKSLFDEVGGLNENLKCVFDYDLFIKMLLIEKPYYYDKNIAFYREHKNTLTRKYICIQGLEIIKVSRKYGSRILDKIVLSSIIKKVLLPFVFYR
jgi:glycosyltransferase involved in cell wall biosynthesis